MTTGAQLRDQGIADTLAADVAPHRGYAQVVRQAVESLACRWDGATFSAEDVRDEAERLHPNLRAHHPNVLPGAMKAMSDAGLIRATGWTEARRPEARGRALRLWRPTTPPAAPPSRRT